MDMATSEVVWRLGAFLAIFAVMADLERARPKRPLVLPLLMRWRTNLAIVGIDSLAVRLMAALPSILGAVSVPLVAVAAAVLVGEWGWGLLNNVSWPAWLEVIVALIVLDFAIWFQHLASHKVPIL